MYHVLPKIRFFGLHFVIDSMGLTSTIVQCLKPRAIEPGKIMQNYGHDKFLVLIKVTTCCINRKPVGDFLLMNNTNLHPVSYCFQVTVDYW